MKIETSDRVLRAAIPPLNGILATVCAAVIATLPSSSLFAAESAPLVLVEQGQPRAVIVVEPDPPAPPPEAAPANPANPKAKPRAKPAVPPPLSKQRRAAEEIQKYVQMMSGAKLPIVTEGSPVEGKPAVTILVGHTEAAKKLGVKIPAGFNPAIRPEAFEEEGYVLKTGSDRAFGDYLVVAGNSDGPYQGTIYAAYALLEKLGCRWYFPGEWGEVVPESPTVKVPEMAVESRPDFAVRSISHGGWVPVTREESAAYREWAARIGFSGGRFYPGVGDGFLAGLLEPNEYFGTHPEYFAMNEAGQRHAGKLPTGRYYMNTTMLCLSNPEVFTESVKNLKAAFAGEKQMHNASLSGFGISPPDGTPYCYCKECKALSQNFNFPSYIHRTLQSEEFFGFAARLAREFPDKWAATMAYALREMPPQGVTLPANVAVTYAPISCDVLHPNNSHLWRRQEMMSILSEWCRISRHVTLYDYSPGFLLGMWVPERDVANMTINAPIYKKLGMKGFVREGRKAFMQTWIGYYVCGKLFWNTNADVPAIKKDFYETFFGPAAGPHVQAWWDACEKALGDSPMQAHEDWLINHIYDVKFAQGIRRHVEAALAAPATEAQKKRVGAFALIAEHLMAYAQMSEAEQRLDYAGAALACQRMTDAKEKLSAIYSFFISVAKGKPRPYFAEGYKLKFEGLAAKADGTAGKLVAPLPPQMAFSRDRFNAGVPAKWYAPEFDDSKWEKKDTYLTWDQQDPPEDAAGHDYDGYGWYRAAFAVDKSFAGKPVRFYCGGALNEAWVWVNGQYAGHKPHRIWWSGPHDFELDVTSLIKPGQPNTVAIRVWNDAEIGGLYRKGFFWSPNASAPAAPSP